jgi:FMN-dependent NADH-azoreductase
MKILHLDSSVIGTNSVSRTLSAEVVAAQVAQNPGAEVTYHDLANEPVMHLSPAHLAAFQGAPVESPSLEQDLAQGGRYLEELLAADVLVIAAPMYTENAAAGRGEDVGRKSLDQHRLPVLSRSQLQTKPR